MTEVQEVYCTCHLQFLKPCQVVGMVVSLQFASMRAVLFPLSEALDMLMNYIEVGSVCFEYLGRVEILCNPWLL